MTQKIEELRQRAEAYLSTARKILDGAEEGHRQLTPAETRDFEGLQHKAAGLKALVRSSGEIRSMIDANTKTAFGPVTPTVRAPLMFGETRAYRPDELIGPVAYDGPGLGAWVRGMVTGRWEPEHRALAESLGTAGGFLVPDPLAGFVIDLARAKSVIVGAGAITVPMETATLTIPRVLTDPTCSWRAENEDIGTGDPTFGASILTARNLATLVKIPNELLMDSTLADGIVTEAITGAMAVALDTAALMGSGTVNEPLGIVNRKGVQTLEHGTGGVGAGLDNFKPFVLAAGMIADANGPSEGLSLILSSRDDTALNGLQDGMLQPMRSPEVVAKMKRLVTSKIPRTIHWGSSDKASWAVVGALSQVILGMRQQFTLEISREAGDAFSKNQTWIRAILRMDVELTQPKWIVVVQGILGV